MAIDALFGKETFIFYCLIFLFIILFRISIALIHHFHPAAGHPDEYWQSIEVAYRLAFGIGILTWDSLTCLRPCAHAQLLAFIFSFLRWLGVYEPTHYLLCTRLFHSLITAATDIFTFVSALTLGHTLRTQLCTSNDRTVHSARERTVSAFHSIQTSHRDLIFFCLPTLFFSLSNSYFLAHGARALSNHFESFFISIILLFGSILFHFVCCSSQISISFILKCSLILCLLWLNACLPLIFRPTAPLFSFPIALVFSFACLIVLHNKSGKTTIFHFFLLFGLLCCLLFLLVSCFLVVILFISSHLHYKCYTSLFPSSPHDSPLSPFLFFPSACNSTFIPTLLSYFIPPPPCTDHLISSRLLLSSPDISINGIIHAHPRPHAPGSPFITHSHPPHTYTNHTTPSLRTCMAALWPPTLTSIRTHPPTRTAMGRFLTFNILDAGATMFEPIAPYTHIYTTHTDRQTPHTHRDTHMDTLYTPPVWPHTHGLCDAATALGPSLLTALLLLPYTTHHIYKHIQTGKDTATTQDTHRHIHTALYTHVLLLIHILFASLCPVIVVLYGPHTEPRFMCPAVPGLVLAVGALTALGMGLYPHHIPAYQCAHWHRTHQRSVTVIILCLAVLEMGLGVWFGLLHNTGGPALSMWLRDHPPNHVPSHHQHTHTTTATAPPPPPYTALLHTHIALPCHTTPGLAAMVPMSSHTHTHTHTPHPQPTPNSNQHRPPVWAWVPTFPDCTLRLAPPHIYTHTPIDIQTHTVRHRHIRVGVRVLRGPTPTDLLRAGPITYLERTFPPDVWGPGCLCGGVGASVSLSDTHTHGSPGDGSGSGADWTHVGAPVVTRAVHPHALRVIPPPLSLPSLLVLPGSLVLGCRRPVTPQRYTVNHAVVDMLPSQLVPVWVTGNASVSVCCPYRYSSSYSQCPLVYPPTHTVCDWLRVRGFIHIASIANSIFPQLVGAFDAMSEAPESSYEIYARLLCPINC